VIAKADVAVSVSTADVMDSMVDPAVFEISGHIVLKRQEDYDKADQAWAWRLLEYASLPEARFKDVTALALGDAKATN
jgi:GDP-L-galactose phosphorylase